MTGRDPLRASACVLRERVGAALVRVGAARAAERRAMVARIAALPAQTPGRDRALGDLAVGVWVESALLWLGWRLLPGGALPNGVARDP